MLKDKDEVAKDWVIIDLALALNEFCLYVLITIGTHDTAICKLFRPAQCARVS